MAERSDAETRFKVCFTVGATKRAGGEQNPIGGTESCVCHGFPQAGSPNCQEVSSRALCLVAFKCRLWSVHSLLPLWELGWKSVSLCSHNIYNTLKAMHPAVIEFTLDSNAHTYCNTHFSTSGDTMRYNCTESKKLIEDQNRWFTPCSVTINNE